MFFLMEPTQEWVLEKGWAVEEDWEVSRRVLGPRGGIREKNGEKIL